MAHEMAQRMMWQHIEEQQALYRQSQSARGKKGKKGGQKHKRQHGQAPAELWRREHHSESERRAQAEQWLAQQKLSDTYLQPVRPTQCTTHLANRSANAFVSRPAHDAARTLHVNVREPVRGPAASAAPAPVSVPAGKRSVSGRVARARV